MLPAAGAEVVVDWERAGAEIDSRKRESDAKRVEGAISSSWMVDRIETVVGEGVYGETREGQMNVREKKSGMEGRDVL